MAFDFVPGQPDPQFLFYREEDGETRLVIGLEGAIMTYTRRPLVKQDEEANPQLNR